jgi:hypothetical protein
MTDRRHSIDLPKTKKFGGQEYKLYDGYKTIERAKETAIWLRDKTATILPWRTRIVKTRSLAFPYAVYYRPVHGWNKPKKARKS